jgi:hypothetical protein
MGRMRMGKSMMPAWAEAWLRLKGRPIRFMGG